MSCRSDSPAFRCEGNIGTSGMRKRKGTTVTARAHAHAQSSSNQTFFKRPIYVSNIETENLCEHWKTVMKKSSTWPHRFRIFQCPLLLVYFELFYWSCFEVCMYVQVYFVYSVLHVHLFIATPKGQGNDTLNIKRVKDYEIIILANYN